MKHEWIPLGAHVKGCYCDQLYSGTVTGTRVHTLLHVELLRIVLDTPINVYGVQRTSLTEVDARYVTQQDPVSAT